MDIKAIRTRRDYKKALAQLESLMDAKTGSAPGDRLEVLSILIAAYEEKNFPINTPDPVSAIRFRMEQRGFGQKDLARLVGSRSRASEILNRRRPLSMETARRLHAEWGIPAEALLKGYPIKEKLRAA